MQYLILFLEGIITFVSPCLLPMLPIYISYFAASGEETPSPKKTLINAGSFVGGFTAVFVALGFFAGTLGSFLRLHQTSVNIVTGIVVIIFGLNYLGVLNLKLLNSSSQKKAPVKALKAPSAFLFGVVFSLGWTPCIGAFLGSALLLASQQGSSFAGFLMLLCYSVGLGVPFILSAVLINRLKTAFSFIKKHYKIINTISGILLVCMGVLMVTGLMGRFLALLSF